MGHDHFGFASCCGDFERPRTDRQILADAQHLLYKQAKERHAERVRELDAELDAELAQIDRTLGL